MRTKLILGTCMLFMTAMTMHVNAQSLKLNDLNYFEERGVNVLVYSNLYNGSFCDEKLAGIEIIQRGERISTGGGIRLMNTPEQWDIYADKINRTVNREQNCIDVDLTYTQYDFVSKIRVTPKDKGVLVQVLLDKPVPEKLAGKAGMNIEFFPASYFGKTYLCDGKGHILPKYPQSDTEVRPISEKIPQFYGESTFDDRGRGEFLVAHPLSTGKQIVLAPEDDNLCVSIKSDEDVSLFDGRLLAQNGTFVVRSLLPTDKTGKVLEWYVEPKCDPNWVRKPNIGISQIGYTPAQKKISVVELDKNDVMPTTANILRVNADGSKTVALAAPVSPWGVYNNRYTYAKVDFSSVVEPGIYVIDFNGTQTNAFPIDKDVYSDKWHASMDVSLVVAMDHMEVNEAYRVWHGCANMDDALQAPANVRLHDGYSQDGETNDKYKPLEHIPGLAVGGWYDAGDFDIQANSVLNTTEDLSTLWRLFQPKRDMTYIDEKTKYADIHRPDGCPDVVQQIMHGTLNINAQVENIGFVAQVIGQPDMHHYHHLGDALTLTDGKLYDPSLGLYEVSADGKRSGTPDDRFVFTSRFSPRGTMGTIATLALAYNALKDYYPEEAERSLKNAEMLFDKYYPETLKPVEVKENNWYNRFSRATDAAMELYFATGNEKYKKIFMSDIKNNLNPKKDTANYSWAAGFAPASTLLTAIRVYDMLDKKTQQKVKDMVPTYVESISKFGSENPYGVAIRGEGWAGNNFVISNSFNLYLIWKKFPDMVDPELILNGMNYIFGCHPYSNVSFVTGVGVNTKKVAYGNNRSDYTTIAGGIVPGLLVKNPDYLENKDDYPFLWGENECCINSVPNYVMFNLAAQEVAEAINSK